MPVQETVESNTQMLAEQVIEYFSSKIDGFSGPEIRFFLKLYGVHPVAKLKIQGKKGKPSHIYSKKDIEKAVALLEKARKDMRS